MCTIRVLTRDNGKCYVNVIIVYFYFAELKHDRSFDVKKFRTNWSDHNLRIYLLHT